MKHALLICMILWTLWGGCLELSAQDRSTRKAQTAAQVTQQLDDRDFYVDITLVQPVGLATFTPSRGQYFPSVRNSPMDSV